MSNAARRTALGGRVERLRLAQNLSQNEVARRGGLSASQVTRIESGANAAPQLDTLKRLADGLGVSVAELLKPTSADVQASPIGLRANAQPGNRAGNTPPPDAHDTRTTEGDVSPSARYYVRGLNLGGLRDASPRVKREVVEVLLHEAQVLLLRAREQEDGNGHAEG